VLRARNLPENHPLRSVVVDSQNMRFCAMSFSYGSRSALSLTGGFEVHFATVGKYWLVTDGLGDLAVRALGIRASHVHLTYTYTDFTFDPVRS
jgi:hypothetical protein